MELEDNEDFLEKLEERKKKLFEENKHDLKKSAVVFVGGHVDGEKMFIPNGVQELTVESDFGPVVYVRSKTNPQQFLPQR